MNGKILQSNGTKSKKPPQRDRNNSGEFIIFHYFVFESKLWMMTYSRFLIIFSLQTQMRPKHWLNHKKLMLMLNRISYKHKINHHPGYNQRLSYNKPNHRQRHLLIRYVLFNSLLNSWASIFVGMQFEFFFFVFFQKPPPLVQQSSAPNPASQAAIVSLDPSKIVPIQIT